MKKIVTIMVLIIIIQSQIAYGAPVSIVLDGSFEDWRDKPGVQLKYDWNNKEQFHTVKWHMDDDNLYLYIKMGTRGGQGLHYYQIVYYVDNGPSRQLALAPDTPGGGRISIIDTNNGYRVLTTDGRVVRGNNNNGKTSDQGEFRIPLTTFRQDTNNQMFTLRLQFPNLGSESIIFEAGSTYPFIGIAICVLAVVLGVISYKRKRRNRV